jgi:hypothetical protein
MQMRFATDLQNATRFATQHFHCSTNILVQTKACSKRGASVPRRHRASPEPVAPPRRQRTVFRAAQRRRYTALSETSDNGYPVLDHVKKLVKDEIIWAPAITGAFVLTTRGGDFDLHLGQDVSIGYLSHTDSVVRLYLQETLTFLLPTSEAAVALAPPATS